MKVFLFALVAVVAGVSGSTVPKSAEARFVDGIIINAINDLSANIKDAGLDPIHVPNGYFGYKVPVTNLFAAEAILDELRVDGLSNIKINRVDFAVLTFRLRFDIELPEIALSLGTASGEILLGHYEASASARGSLSIQRIRVAGQARVSVGIITGVSVNNLSIDLTIGNVASNLNVVIMNNDISERLNSVLGEAIPGFFSDFRSDINLLLEYVVGNIIDGAL